MTAIKVHAQERDYSRERDVHLRLRESQVTAIRGCVIPEMICSDDALWIIEMTVVTHLLIS